MIAVAAMADASEEPDETISSPKELPALLDQLEYLLRYRVPALFSWS